jgi:hypothetical protein
MVDSRVILLVSNNRHPLIESDFGHRVERFTDQNTCVVHILNEMARCRRIDLFLSSTDRMIIGINLPLFNNVYFHLYCLTANDIPNNEALFPLRAYVQVFEEDYLWVEIGYAILEHDNARLRVSNQSPNALTAWQMTHRILLEEVKAAKLGVQPN